MNVLMRYSAYQNDPLYGIRVREWQAFLISKGLLNPGGDDGDFGPATASATRAFQRSAGLTDDGKAGPKTLAAADKQGFDGGFKPPKPRNINGFALAQIRGIENCSDEFLKKVVEISGRLEIDPNHLMAVMAFESGHSFSASKRNPVSQAVGLIQFTPIAVKDLNQEFSQQITMTALSRMSEIDQLDWVERHFKTQIKRHGKLKSVQDVYMAVLWPKLIGADNDAIMTKVGTKEYRQNKSLDWNNNGFITKAEAARRVTEILEGAPRVVIPKDDDDDDRIEEHVTEVQPLKKGQRGAEVREVQEMLVALGHLTQAQMNTGPGVFGSLTEAAVEEFQHEHQLEYSGVVDTLTLHKLKQKFEKMPPGERVDPKAITTQIPPTGPGFVTYGPRWKKFTTIGVKRKLDLLIERWGRSHPRHKVQIGNISKRGGGTLSPHKTHKEGRDVDFRPFRKDFRLLPVRWRDSDYDRETTRAFIELVAELFPGAKILFNDQVTVNAKLTRKAGGHDNHLHITFPV